MIEIIPKWGAMYLKYDEPIEIEKQNLISKENVEVIVGQKISKIGSKKRTSFEMNAGVKLVYEGVFHYHNTSYAIFNSTDFKPKIGQTEMFENPINYRYAFAIVSDFDEKLICFLIFTQNWMGSRDIVLDEIS